MQVWLRWLVWLNPLYYGFEAAMVNEVCTRSLSLQGTHLLTVFHS